MELGVPTPFAYALGSAVADISIDALAGRKIDWGGTAIDTLTSGVLPFFLGLGNGFNRSFAEGIVGGLTTYDPQAQTLTLSATPQVGTDYIYTQAYVSQGTTWTAYALQGNNAYPSYSSAAASLTLSSAQLSALSLGTHYAVIWDWLWDANTQCYKGPGLNQCNTGQWRLPHLCSAR